MSILAAAEIPTLRLLYKLKKLDPPPTTLTPLKGATAAYNNKIATIQGDITKLDVDAIVNAANRSLLGGGGVDGAIHRAAGPGLQDECRILGGCATGTSKITDAYELPCRKVIHTVGPVYNELYGDRCAVALRGCYQSSLLLAAQYGLKTIAFSAVSTGVYGYPSLEAAKIACATARDFLSTEFGKKMDKIIFVTFEEKDVRAYNFILPRFFPPSREEAQSIDSEAAVAELPSVPKTDPSDSEHVQKKQKQNGNTI